MRGTGGGLACVQRCIILMAGILQIGKHRLCFLCRRRVRLVLRTGCESSEPEEDECVCQGPTFGNIVLNSNVAVAQAITGHAHSLDNLLDAGLVDKVVESELVGVLEFKFVVVC